MSGEEQQKQMFTKWFNVDRPWSVRDNQVYGSGDYESVHNIRNFFSTICEDNYEIAGAECRLSGRESDVFTEKMLIDTGDILHTPCTRDGLICREEDQAPGRMCGDYAVRFLCKHMGDDDPERDTENMFPEFDARIYLVLAIIPVLIFIIRLAWAYVFRQRRRHRRRQRREERRRRGEAREGEEAEEDDDTASINSDLARPPPSYQELFTEGTPSSVFTISGRSTSPCPKCKDAQCSVVTGGVVGSRQEHLSTDPSHPPSPSSSSVTDSTDSNQTNCSTVDSSSQRQTSESIPLGNLNSLGVEIVDETSRGSSPGTPTETSQSDPNNPADSSVSADDTVSITMPGDSTVPADVPSPCACACHRTIPLSSQGVVGYENPAFTPDGEVASPSNRNAPHRGRHISAIPRNVSDISVLSQITLSELPSYEDALKLEKKLAKEEADS